jgi:hypothetical protein
MHVAQTGEVSRTPTFGAFSVAVAVLCSSACRFDDSEGELPTGYPNNGLIRNPQVMSVKLTTPTN